MQAHKPFRAWAHVQANVFMWSIANLAKCWESMHPCMLIDAYSWCVHALALWQSTLQACKHFSLNWILEWINFPMSASQIFKFPFTIALLDVRYFSVCAIINASNSGINRRYNPCGILQMKNGIRLTGDLFLSGNNWLQVTKRWTKSARIFLGGF